MKIGLDLDGTLISCRERQTTLLQAIFKSQKINIDIDFFWYEKRNGNSNKNILANLGFSDVVIKDINLQWIQQIETFPWLYLDNELEKVRSILKHWVSCGYELHLISARSNSTTAMLQIKYLDLYTIFNSINFVNPFSTINKSSVMKKIKLDYYVGDTEIDFDQALKSNIKPLIISSGMRSPLFFLKKGISFIDNFEKIELIIN